MIDLYDLDALRCIGLTRPILERLMTQPPAPGQRPMRVTEVQRDAITLHDGHREHAARCRPALIQRLSDEGQALAVGDWVVAEARPGGGWFALARVPALTQIQRRTHDGRGGIRRQVLVSNVDLALLVMGLDHDFNPRRLERYVALARLAGLELLLVLTKADGCTPARRAHCVAEAAPLLPAGTPVLAVDGRDDTARAALQPWLVAGRTLVLLGSSGAGKSTLTNTLAGWAHGSAPQATGAVRVDDGRGRHTTTVRSLHETPEGACIIDTPGLRALRLDAADEDALDAAFDDIAGWSPQCRFRDCRHQQEPGCAVREHVGAPRLANYHKLQREAGRDRLSPGDREARLRQWKARARAARAVAAAKRG